MSMPWKNWDRGLVALLIALGAHAPAARRHRRSRRRRRHRRAAGGAARRHRHHEQRRHRPDAHRRPPTRPADTCSPACRPKGRYECNRADRLRQPGPEHLVFNAGQRAVINIQMKLSTLQETITVAGDSPIVQTTSAEVSTTIDRRRSRRCR